MEPEVEITQADESKYLLESVNDRKHDIEQQDIKESEESLFINWKTDILETKKTPSLQDDILSIIRGFRNGFIYGIKIRLPHAFVMTLIFASDRSIESMSKTIFKKTREHSVHLGQYVCLYKLLIVLIRRILNYPHNHFPIIHILGIIYFLYLSLCFLIFYIFI